MSWSHISPPRINNVLFREPDDNRYHMHHSMERYHRKNRGFPTRPKARAVIAPELDTVKKAPFRYRLPPPNYRPTNPLTSDAWRSHGEQKNGIPVSSNTLGLSHARRSSTDETPYGTAGGGKRTRTSGNRLLGNVVTRRKSPDAFVLPQIATAQATVGVEETDNKSTPRTITSPRRRSRACPDRLPPVSTRSEPAHHAEGYDDQWNGSLTSLLQRRANHREALRVDGESTDDLAWKNKLLTTSTVIDTDSYDLYARTVPAGRQRRRCADKHSNVQT